MIRQIKEAVKKSVSWCVVLCTCVWASAGWAQDFAWDEMSIEDLMEVEVFSASKKEEPLFVSPAAVYVLTAEEIHRSGATSIPDALRGVPGVEVARIDASKWAVSVRGFNDVFADKLLVMIDGRTIYSPLFNGVIWSEHEIALQDVERIEVVRGPGGTLWGANAVNGVINIITRSATDTKGIVVTQSLGSETRARVSTSYGLKIGPWNGALRLHYASYGSTVRNGQNANDEWSTGRIGFRADRTLDNGDQLLLDVSGYSNEARDNYRIPIFDSPFIEERNADSHTSGGYVVAGWSRTVSDRSSWRVTAYYDDSNRDTGELTKGELHTWDIDLLHNWQLSDRHQLVWGAGYRQYWDSFREGEFVYFSPSSRWYSVRNAFVQDEFTLWPNRLKITAGAKVEHSSFSGVSVSPSARVAWTPNASNTAWAAFSRANRTPARGDQDLRAIGSVQEFITGTRRDTALFVLRGSSNFKDEQAESFEVGYRALLGERFRLDMAAYSTRYMMLHTNELVTPEFDPRYGRVVFPISFANNMDAVARGFEVALDTELTAEWRLRGTYTHTDISVEVDGFYDEGSSWEYISPAHQFALRSSNKCLWDVLCDLQLRYVGEVGDFRGGEYIAQADAYWGLDLRFSKAISDRLEIALMGHNLLNDRHTEFRVPITPIVESDIQRGFNFSVRWTPESL